MNRRITLPELADGVAKRATVPVSFAEKFVQSFFDVVEEALVKEKLVKVKGLGTFKLVDVDARESVDVNSGERILLAAHSKVTFTPDAGLRDAINRPFADFETVILNDSTPTEKMEAIDNEAETVAEGEVQAEKEPVMVVEPKVEAATQVVEAAESAVEAEPEVESEPVAEAAPAVEAESEPEAEADIAATSETEAAPAVESEPLAETETKAETSEPVEAEATEAGTAAKVQALQSIEPQTAAPETEEQGTNKHEIEEQETNEQGKNEQKAETETQTNIMRKTIQNILAALLCLFIGYAICYYFRPFELPTLSPAPLEQKATKAEQKEAEETKAPAEATETAKTTETTPAAPAAKPAQSYQQLEGGEYEIVGVKGTEVMSPGKTLLNISLKYYKSTDFVPYICKMNGIDNPDIVPLDKELQIPELKKK
ncbi:MAG: HU family DNA-binding protein [Bacteroidaceae bacterium]|nr:HU family DNA-binding protein [Bacteroidaceae bacterium]